MIERDFSYFLPEFISKFRATIYKVFFMSGEPKRKEGNEHSRVSVTLGNFKVEIEGTQENVESLMGTPIYQFIEKLQDIVGEVPSSEEGKEEGIAPPSEYPPTIGKPSSAMDAVTKLMSDRTWGKNPKTFSEIKLALETSGVYYSKGALAGGLNYLVKKGTLRRLGTRGDFKYVAT